MVACEKYHQLNKLTNPSLPEATLWYSTFSTEKGTKSVAQCLISLNEDSYWDVHGTPI